MSDQLTRQQIYDRIRNSSRDQFILEEMQRLGFWTDSKMHSNIDHIIKRETELHQELNKAYTKKKKYDSQDAMLKEMRKARMKKAKEKRIQTKEKNNQKKNENAANWAEYKNKNIIYLGKDISPGLSNTQSNIELLQKFNLQEVANLESFIANANITMDDLRYLAFQRKVSKINHYSEFEIPKKSGGVRKLSAPKKKLKTLQSFLLEEVFNKLQHNDHAHGFITNKSIVTNAAPHVGKNIIVNIDLENFFPTITYNRVKGMFIALGFSEQMAIIYSLICTKYETQKIAIDGQIYYVQQGERYLPQGSPASPAISNTIAYSLDLRLVGLAKKYGFEYTRYADDLTFSCDKANEQNVSKLLYYVSKCVSEEGFVVNKNKTHIMRSGDQQKVTGIVVNKLMNVEKKKLKKFRALLHNITLNGWKDQKWGNAIHLINAIEGTINFINMVNPTKAKLFTESLDKIIILHGRPEAPKKEISIIDKMVDSPLPKVKKAESEETVDWWNIFKL